jgi:hypothetical protein
MSGPKVLTEEDYLRMHLENLETSINIESPEIQQPQPQSNTPFNTNKSSDLHYFSFDIQEFPCGFFYPKGTTIQVRAAQVKEIQAYSMVDDNNYYDILEKMNDMLSSCVRIKHIDGTIGSYIEIRDPDRYYLIFLIRELTFQKGTILSTNVKCSCGEENSIELIRMNFKKYDIDQKLIPYFDSRYNCFIFQLTNDKTYYLTPPTIGVQKAFTEYVIRENIQKRKPNLSFLKIIPFTLVGKTSINQDEIKSELEKFQKIDDISFQFLNSAVEKMTFGIEKLIKYCQCGLEIHTPMSFPNGPSAIFVIHDAFDQFIKK